jgi:hypothetical protein
MRRLRFRGLTGRRRPSQFPRCSRRQVRGRSHRADQAHHRREPPSCARRQRPLRGFEPADWLDQVALGRPADPRDRARRNRRAPAIREVRRRGARPVPVFTRRHRPLRPRERRRHPTSSEEFLECCDDVRFYRRPDRSRCECSSGDGHRSQCGACWALSTTTRVDDDPEPCCSNHCHGEVERSPKRLCEHGEHATRSGEHDGRERKRQHAADTTCNGADRDSRCGGRRSALGRCSDREQLTRPHGRYLSRRPRAEDDDCRAHECDSRAKQVPSVRSRAFDRPQPNERRRDVDAPVRGVRSPRVSAVDERQQPREQRE